MLTSCKKDEKTIEAELVSMSWQRLQAEIQSAEAAIRELTTEVEKHQAELTHFKAEFGFRSTCCTSLCR